LQGQGQGKKGKKAEKCNAADVTVAYAMAFEMLLTCCIAAVRPAVSRLCLCLLLLCSAFVHLDFSAIRFHVRLRLCTTVTPPVKVALPPALLHACHACRIITFNMCASAPLDPLPLPMRPLSDSLILVNL
jgi:hypothetical protein